MSAALKPSSEHWIVARAPLERGLNVAENVAKWGTGALQIDAARVARGESTARPTGERLGILGAQVAGIETGGHAGGSWPPNFALSHCPECEERGTRIVSGGADPGAIRRGATMGYGGDKGGSVGGGFGKEETVPAFDCLASCPCGATVLAASGGEPPRCACGSAMEWACPVALMDQESGQTTSGSILPHHVKAASPNLSMSGGNTARTGETFTGDSGGASRFFPRFTYAAKSASAERHAGCDDLLWRADKRSPFGFVRVSRAEWEGLPDLKVHTGQNTPSVTTDATPGCRAAGNVHPTVKSLALMEWLVALVTPKGGRIGDITCGSGGTGIALHRLNVTRDLGASFLGCDVCPEAIEIAQARLRWWAEHTAQQRGLFGEHAAIVAKPERPAKARAPKVEPVASPPVDARQRGLFA